MIFRAILDMLAGRPVPEFHNTVVHDQRNIRTAVLAGHTLMVKLAEQSNRAYERGDRDAVRHTRQKQSEVMSGLEDLARRID